MRPSPPDGEYAVPDRILRGALGATLLVVLAACSEQVTGSLGCPELCTDQSAQLRDTVLTGTVAIDSTFVGFPRLGDPSSLTLVAQGDTADVRLVARFDTLVTTYRATGATADSAITRVDSATLILALDSAASKPAGLLTIEAFDVDTTAEDTLTSALLPLFRADRRLGGLTFSVSAKRDTVRIPLSNAAVLGKITGGQRLRIGLRLTGGTGPEARRVRILRAPSPIVRYRVSTDSLVPPDTVSLRSRTPTNFVDVANGLTIFPVVARGALPAPSGSILAVGGLGGARTYMRFDIPGIVLDSVQVIRATLQLTQRPSRSPGAVRDSVSLLVHPVIAGPAVTDVLTSSLFIGAPLAIDTLRLAPRDSGRRELELVALVRTWRALGTTNTTRAIVLRGVQEGELPGELNFFSSSTANPALLRPILRLTYVPRRGFGLP
ncbi:MAG: hypothetical protein JWL60_1264 [Gemmatimonadetes bacterium]|jgi:hypothetical protein|nr:hypothetical protein [Gemmatimonadota bacterium]